MSTLTTKKEVETRLRARQLQRLHAHHLVHPQLNAERILASDIVLAQSIEPDFTAREGELDWEDRWVQRANSLPQILARFRKSAEVLVLRNKGVDVVEEENQDEEDKEDGGEGGNVESQGSGQIETIPPPQAQPPRGVPTLRVPEIPSPRVTRSMTASTSSNTQTAAPTSQKLPSQTRPKPTEPSAPKPKSQKPMAKPQPVMSGPMAHWTQNLQTYASYFRPHPELEPQGKEQSPKQAVSPEENSPSEQSKESETVTDYADGDVEDSVPQDSPSLDERREAITDYADDVEDMAEKMPVPKDNPSLEERLAAMHMAQEQDPQTYAFPSIPPSHPGEESWATYLDTYHPEEITPEPEIVARTDIHPILTAENLKVLTEMRVQQRARRVRGE